MLLAAATGAGAGRRRRTGDRPRRGPRPLRGPHAGDLLLPADPDLGSGAGDRAGARRPAEPGHELARDLRRAGRLRAGAAAGRDLRRARDPAGGAADDAVGCGPPCAASRSCCRDRLFVGAALSAGLAGASMFAYIAGSTFVLQRIYGLSPAGFSLAFGANSLGIMAIGQVGGRLARRWSAPQILALGLLVNLVGAAGLATTVLLGWVCRSWSGRCSSWSAPSVWSSRPRPRWPWRTIPTRPGPRRRCSVWVSTSPAPSPHRWSASPGRTARCRSGSWRSRPASAPASCSRPGLSGRTRPAWPPSRPRRSHRPAGVTAVAARLPGRGRRRRDCRTAVMITPASRARDSHQRVLGDHLDHVDGRLADPVAEVDVDRPGARRRRATSISRNVRSRIPVAPRVA